MAETKITLFGRQQCRYLWALNEGISEANKSNLVNKNTPRWTIDTAFLTTFANGLRAGNLSYGEKPNRYDVHREEIGGNKIDFVGSIYDTKVPLIDYACRNNEAYKYNVSVVMDNYITTPVSSEQINTMWDNWCLMLVDDTDVPDRYTINSAYFFEYNLEVGEMRTNTQTNILRTFSQFLRVQKDGINSLGGSLRSLVGKIDCLTGKYSNTPNEVNAIRELSTSLKKKFLRDVAGNIYQVDVSSDVGLSINSYAEGEVYTKSIEWIEVGSAEDVSITGSVV